MLPKYPQLNGSSVLRILSLAVAIALCGTLPVRAESTAPTAGLDPAKKGDSLPVPLQQVPPDYPPNLKKKKIEGQAVVQFIVEKDGTVKVAEVISQTRPEFGVAAIECVKAWKFRPGQHDGHAVRCSISTPIVFKLQ